MQYPGKHPAKVLQCGECFISDDLQASAVGTQWDEIRQRPPLSIYLPVPTDGDPGNL